MPTVKEERTELLSTEAFRKKTVVLVAAYSNLSNAMLLGSAEDSMDKDRIFKILRKAQKLAREVLKSEMWNEKLTKQITTLLKHQTESVHHSLNSGETTTALLSPDILASERRTPRTPLKFHLKNAPSRKQSSDKMQEADSLVNKYRIFNIKDLKSSKPKLREPSRPNLSQILSKKPVKIETPISHNSTPIRANNLTSNSGIQRKGNLHTSREVSKGQSFTQRDPQHFQIKSKSNHAIKKQPFIDFGAKRKYSENLKMESSRYVEQPTLVAPVGEAKLQMDETWNGFTKAIPEQVRKKEAAYLVQKIRDLEKENEIIRLKKKERNHEDVESTLNLEILLLLNHIVRQNQLQSTVRDPGSQMPQFTGRIEEASSYMDPAGGAHGGFVEGLSTASQYGKKKNESYNDSVSHLGVHETKTIFENQSVYLMKLNHQPGSATINKSDLQKDRLRRKRRLLSLHDTRLNSKRLKDSFYGESISLSLSFHTEDTAINVVMRLLKNQSGQLVFELNPAFEKSSNSETCSLSQYLMLKFSMNEQDFFMLLKKIDFLYIDLVPFDHLIFNHMEYMMSKCLCHFIDINYDHSKKTLQPYLSKKPFKINEPIKADFFGFKYSVEVFYRSEQSFYINLRVAKDQMDLPNSAWHIRSHLYMDKTSFDKCFVRFSDHSLASQTTSLFCCIEEKVDCQKLNRDFSQRQLVFNRADQKYDSHFQSLFEELLNKMLNLVSNKTSFSLSDENQVYFCAKAVNYFENFVVYVIENQPLDNRIQVCCYYCFTAAGRNNLPGVMETQDQFETLAKEFHVSYAYFRNHFGVDFSKLSFERKKYFFELIVLANEFHHTEKDHSEDSADEAIGRNVTPNTSQIIVPEQIGTAETPGNFKKQISRLKRISISLEMTSREPRVLCYKRAFMGLEYRYPIIMACIAYGDTPVGFKVYLMNLSRLEANSLFLAINRSSFPMTQSSGNTSKQKRPKARTQPPRTNPSATSGLASEGGAHSSGGSLSTKTKSCTSETRTDPSLPTKKTTHSTASSDCSTRPSACPNDRPLSENNHSQITLLLLLFLEKIKPLAVLLDYLP